MADSVSFVLAVDAKVFSFSPSIDCVVLFCFFISPSNDSFDGTVDDTTDSSGIGGSGASHCDSPFGNDVTGSSFAGNVTKSTTNGSINAEAGVHSDHGDDGKIDEETFCDSPLANWTANDSLDTVSLEGAVEDVRLLTPSIWEISEGKLLGGLVVTFRIEFKSDCFFDASVSGKESDSLDLWHTRTQSTSMLGLSQRKASFVVRLT